MGKRVYSLAATVGAVLSLLLTCLLIAADAAEAQQVETAEAIEAAAEWLVSTHQNDDGGFTAFSAGANAAPSDFAGTVDALLALAAVGEPVEELLASLESQPEAVAVGAAQSGGSAGKLVLALVVAGADPRDFAGFSPVITLTQHFSPDGAANVADPYNQALAILGLVAAEEAVPPEAIDYLLAGQAAGDELAGSWDDGFGTAGNTDATAMAIMALYASGMEPDSPELQAAGDFLEQNRLETGGWGYAPGLPESANSTSLGLQALSALGRHSEVALSALLAWQQPSGEFAADFGDGPFDDFFTTLQALPALTGQPYPLTGARAELPVEQEEATATAEPEATATSEATATPLPEPTATAEPEATATTEPEPTEAVAAAPEMTSTAPATTTGAETQIEETPQATSSWVAWVLLALALLGAAAVVIWGRSGRGL
jgi:hypothetical protein